MKLLHTFWHIQKGFNNSGRINFWIETDSAIKKKGYCQYQLDGDSLNNWFSEKFPEIYHKPGKASLQLPCNSDGEAVPSPEIVNYNNLGNIEITSFSKYTIFTVEIENPVHFFKELNFQHYYFDNDIKLADDTLFWIQTVKELSRVVKQQQFIPAIVANKKRKISYYTKWTAVSSEYSSSLKKLSGAMPYSAFSSEDIFKTDKFSILEHFSEVVLTGLISATPYTQKIEKNFSDTFIEHAVSGSAKAFPMEDDVWKEWKLWKNNLTYDQFGSLFNLVFQLNSATDSFGTDWNLEILLQSKNDPSFKINLKQYSNDKIKRSSLYNKMFGTSTDRILLLQLGYAARIYPKTEKFLQDSMQLEKLSLSTEEAFQFLKEDAWALNSCGYKITVPSWWTPKGRLKAKIKLKANKSSSSKDEGPVSYFSRDNLVNFDYKMAIGGSEITEDEWRTLIDSKNSLVFFRGEWMEINRNEMEKIRKLLENIDFTESGTMLDLLNKASDEKSYDIECDDTVNAMMEKLSSKEQISDIKQPETLQATLRPYQLRGLSWLSYLEYLGMNPCLADDMGLGKTMQIIALLLMKPGKNAALLVAPTSVIGNWYRELKKFAPGLKAAVHHGSGRKQKDEFKSASEDHDIIITSYGLIRRDKKLFGDINWSRIIIDEAQNIKNPSAVQTKELCKLKSAGRIALTGTPIENRLMDLWSIFNFLNPGYLGGRTAFRKIFEYPIQRDINEYQASVLKNLVEPFILRRLKTDKNIIHDLPDKIEQKIYCQLTDEQASVYQSIVDEVAENYQAVEDKSSRSSVILSTLLRLKQVCNHPAQMLQDGSEFSIERSAKLKRLTETVDEVIEAGSSVLIFSQFTEICSELEKLLKTKKGYRTYYIHGGTSRKKREQMIEEFQDEITPPGIFILSLKAGGVGITLTKANYVIHFDRWWNPSVENQATDRAYRIGQNKTVFVQKFITVGTVEEKIDRMLMDKQQVSDMIVGNDESWLSKLNADSFMDLIKLGRNAMEDAYEDQ
jgi:SNF2 family DNA or RNA helicase